MGPVGFLMALLSLTATGAEMEFGSVSEHLFYGRDSSDREKTLDFFSINSVPFFTYRYEEQICVINGRETDGTAELGEAEVSYYRQRIQGFQPHLRGTQAELIRRTDNATIGSKKPTVLIYMEDDYAPGRSNILYCYAENFYPFEIELSFLINGRPFAGPVRSSQLVVESDWTFNIYKYIEIEPKDGDTFSCRAAHVSLEGELTVSLDLPPPVATSGIIVCAIGVIVGIIGLLVTLYLGMTMHKRQGGVCPVRSCSK